MGSIIYIVNDINWEIKKKMKGRDWLNTLQVDTMWRWHLRVNEYVHSTNNIGYKEHLLEKEWNSLLSLLMSSFSWADTPEGVFYWSELCYTTKTMEPTKLIKKYQFV